MKTKEVKTRRLEKGLTQAELAKHTGLTRQTINNIERGKHSPYVKTLELIAAVLERR